MSPPTCFSALRRRELQGAVAGRLHALCSWRSFSVARLTSESLLDWEAHRWSGAARRRAHPTRCSDGGALVEAALTALAFPTCHRRDQVFGSEEQTQGLFRSCSPGLLAELGRIAWPLLLLEPKGESETLQSVKALVERVCPFLHEGSDRPSAPSGQLASAERSEAVLWSWLPEVLEEAMIRHIESGADRAESYSLRTAGQQSPSVELLESLLLRCVTCTPEEMPIDVVKRLADLVLEICVASHRQGELLHVWSKAMDLAHHEYVATLVHALQVVMKKRDGCQSELPSIEEVQWHSLVPPSLVIKCYQRLLAAVKSIKHHPSLSVYAFIVADTKREFPQNTQLWALHRAVLCCIPDRFPYEMQNQISVLAMSCLRYARLKDLTNMYLYLKQLRYPSPLPHAVLNKFLANCGSCVLTTGTTWEVRNAEHIRAAFEDIRTICTMKECAVKEVEEGLAHGCAVLRALGASQTVRQVYSEFPELRETAHSVGACISLEDVAGALEALNKLGLSQHSGWIYIPAVVADMMGHVSRLVGRRGTAQHVEELYRSLVAFNNKGMLMSNYMESVIGGVADRLFDIPELVRSSLKDGVQRPVPPRAILVQLAPVVESAFQFLGDDVNADVILTLIESAVRSGDYAVPLTVGLMNVLRKAATEHISLLHFFSGGDASTCHSPFLPYFALCVARDFRLTEVFDHLATVWSANGVGIWRRDGSLAPPYKLWKCANCGRPNSDRFNYCACSALRNGFVCCSHCDYAQDERWPVCLGCGAAPDVSSSASACLGVVRKSWSCTECSATNPARQTLLCFRCMKPTGPLSTLYRQERSRRKQPIKSFCQCSYGLDTVETTYTSAIGYCHSCRLFRSAHSRQTSFVWRCSCCHQLRSSLERVCPRCPQIECVPFLYSHAVEEMRHCRECHAAQPNSFAKSCDHCGRLDTGALFQVEESPSAAIFTTPTETDGVRCATCHQVVASSASLLCPHCLQLLLPGTGRSAGQMEVSTELQRWATDASSLLETAEALRTGIHVLLQGRECCDSRESAFAGMEALLCLISTAWGGAQSFAPLASLAQHLEDTLRDLTTGEMKDEVKATSCGILRRCVAYVKRFLTRLDSFQSAASPSRFLKDQCTLCLGSHPEELCGYAKTLWLCDRCGRENTNDGLTRYFCGDCLALRRSVQKLQPARCLECSTCARLNVEFEQYCMFCDFEMPAFRTENLEASACPFFPSRCALCGTLHLEAACPSCTTPPATHLTRAVSHSCEGKSTCSSLSAPTPLWSSADRHASAAQLRPAALLSTSLVELSGVETAATSQRAVR